MLNNKSTPCTTTTRATTHALIDLAKENRSRFITPMWKKSSKFNFNNFRSRIGNFGCDLHSKNIYYFFIYFLFMVLFISYSHEN